MVRNTPCLSLVTVIFMSAIVMAAKGHSQEKNDIWRLRKELFEKRQYDKNVRPTNHEHGPTEIMLQFTFVRIKVDELNGNLLTHGCLSLVWNESSLKWRPREYNNLTYIKVPANEVWIPDIIVQNSYEGLNNYPDSLVNIRHNGAIFHLQKLTLATQCDMDLTYWPFDKQTCSIRVGAWTSDANEVKPILLVDEPELTYFEAGTSPWEIIGAKSELNNLKYAEDMIPRHDVVFTLELQRRSAFDVKMVLVPAIVISLLVLITFWMTPGSPERIHVGCVAVIINTMMLLYFRYVLPASGNHIPLVVVFYVASLSLSAVGIVITLITGSLSRRTTSYDFGTGCAGSHTQSNVCTLSKGSLPLTDILREYFNPTLVSIDSIDKVCIFMY
ncbi:neuronal acetylcholine receptor subunit alpha-3-like isoform X2 [Artemia franciscana]|uniref:neuronal acetylcholine receptor subunit alpha-3-like isoform X2 n=1 Tax=Artemia franciscana TaxID=6661 RepID=UPI0032DA61E2